MTAQHPAAAAGTDPRGWLVFTSLPADLYDAETATAAADHERLGGRNPYLLVSLEQTRPATAAERTLLEHIGFSDLPDDLETHVRLVSPGVIQRRWPVLEEQTKETP